MLQADSRLGQTLDIKESWQHHVASWWQIQWQRHLLIVERCEHHCFVINSHITTNGEMKQNSWIAAMGWNVCFFSKAFLYVVLKACWDIGVFSIHPGRVSEIHCTCPRDNHSRIPLVQLSGSKISSQPYRGWSVQCTIFLSRCVPIDCCISHEDWHFQSPGPLQGSVGKILHLWSQLPSSSMEQRECVWETRDGSSLVKWDVISF